MKRIFNVCAYGAVGDGTHDDSAAIQSALEAAVASSGCLYIPAGHFKTTRPLVLSGLKSQVAIRGDGPNISVLQAHDGNDVLRLDFEQLGAMQPWGLNLMDVGFRAVGRAGTAITVSYGNPEVTSDHYQPSTVLRNVVIASDHLGSWSNGINITAAWNITMTDVSVSGDSAGGNWNALSGSGIHLNRMCVNAHFSNVRCNFWATGIFYHAEGGGNTEGLFFSNCSLIAVQRGVWITGNGGEPAPRVSTVTLDGRIDRVPGWRRRGWFGGLSSGQRLDGAHNGRSVDCRNFATDPHDVWAFFGQLRRPGADRLRFECMALRAVHGGELPRDQLAREYFHELRNPELLQSGDGRIAQLRARPVQQCAERSGSRRSEQTRVRLESSGVNLQPV
jgi:hypothetical protein